MSRLNLAILISGRGTNMDQILRATTSEDYPARARLVLSNREDAAGLEAARAFGVATETVPHTDYEDRQSFERAMHEALTRHEIEIIALAGFMRVLTPWFVEKWAGRMVNIHPSLLPDYPGLNTHARALQAGDSEAGCTVHWVSEGVDEGDIIRQARVPVKSGDTPATLANRVLEAEHRLYPQALAEACRYIIARQAS
ncbi:MAG: phosphoribosylglycinamide formyltransferase [Henriciella sp.]|jgi:formyltetrahydrofolate-dependent phosphoribosylglycinamide formyltransferase|uniref:phosphoribosylglycinamide formyltransferase n=1 Tax=Henriciella sp. TaxID=1968823 RepID=UPI000C11B0D6|nr:phosphoribosylglycinamide formyltransferase [Henriciella sp.]MAN73137.1 phosphoribosylglycinamide formyltransferase [Henriciella sp.]MBF35410.1 phosphoribosylglycinamide formyltransferase [Hyphomonadaceae bacterium]MBK75486.1 phosphoribosylglycinamide formyltransferase [Henriciella sp.]PHR79296.1 MAG: phosphoribosylglycinamide formyltransferase [Henriciella sp.]|tara:strand:+ start:927 stop:1520 length:594 start_codon:yes stop_codon:yes gene_type:complete